MVIRSVSSKRESGACGVRDGRDRVDETPFVKKREVSIVFENCTREEAHYKILLDLLLVRRTREGKI